MTELKRCTKCGEEKELNEQNFRPRFDKRDNRSYWNSQCRVCERTARTEWHINHREQSLSASRDWKNKNKNQQKEYMKKWRENNIDHAKKRDREYKEKNRAIINERAKDYRKGREQQRIDYRRANSDKITQYKKEYYQKNKESLAAKSKLYKESERGRALNIVYTQRRSALKRSLPALLTTQQWENCVVYFNSTCAYCGEQEQLTQEHFIPVSAGGEYTRLNIIPACLSCNSSKGAKSFFDWYPKQPFYSKQREKKIYQYLGYKKEEIELLKSGRRQMRIAY